MDGSSPTSNVISNLLYFAAAPLSVIFTIRGPGSTVATGSESVRSPGSGVQRPLEAETGVAVGLDLMLVGVTSILVMVLLGLAGVGLDGSAQAVPNVMNKQAIKRGRNRVNTRIV